jgi:hypothetical protein
MTVGFSICPPMGASLCKGTPPAADDSEHPTFEPRLQSLYNDLKVDEDSCAPVPHKGDTILLIDGRRVFYNGPVGDEYPNMRDAYEFVYLRNIAGMLYLLRCAGVGYPTDHLFKLMDDFTPYTGNITNEALFNSQNLHFGHDVHGTTVFHRFWIT